MTKKTFQDADEETLIGEEVVPTTWRHSIYEKKTAEWVRYFSI